jgi:hypothetical protein
MKVLFVYINVVVFNNRCVWLSLPPTLVLAYVLLRCSAHAVQRLVLWLSTDCPR